MRPFGFVRPTDPEEAVALVASTPGATFVAGGTNLVDLMKLGVARPSLLVEVTRLGLAATEATEQGGLRIGAAVRNSTLAADPVVRREYPLLAEALLAGASGQVRNMATVAGNLLQRTRCSYFQDVTKPCNKRRPGSGCPARQGDHRNLAVLGASEACIATHPSDMAVALAALDATVEVRTPSGLRALSIDELYRPPDGHPDRDTAVEPGWLVESVELPPPVAGAASRYRKVRDRASFAFALTSIAAVVATTADGRVADLRLAFGALAPRPWRARRAEARLVGEVPTSATVGAAIDDELAEAEPLRDNAFKVPLTRRVATATVMGLVAR